MDFFVYAFCPLTPTSVTDLISIAGSTYTFLLADLTTMCHGPLGRKLCLIILNI